MAGEAYKMSGEEIAFIAFCEVLGFATYAVGWLDGRLPFKRKRGANGRFVK